MALITNNGTINYTLNGVTTDLSSNTVSTDLNVTYSAETRKTASPQTFSPGERIRYQVQVSNTGTGTFYNPRVTDNFGAAGADKPLTYAADTATAFLYEAGGTVTPVDVTVSTSAAGAEFRLAGTIPDDSYVILTYHADVSNTLTAAVTAITNTATFTANSGGTAGAVYNATASETITRETVTILKAASSATVSAGEPLTYTFTLTNIGTTETAVNSLTDRLPANFAVNTVSARMGTSVVTYARDTDYTVSADNLLVLDPATSSTQLVIPAASGGTAGITTVTITGTIVA